MSGGNDLAAAVRQVAQGVADLAGCVEGLDARLSALTDQVAHHGRLLDGLERLLDGLREDHAALLADVRDLEWKR